jgi:hypothetical protein
VDTVFLLEKIVRSPVFGIFLPSNPISPPNGLGHHIDDLPSANTTDTVSLEVVKGCPNLLDGGLVFYEHRNEHLMQDPEDVPK